jgi:hypothetical protein
MNSIAGTMSYPTVSTNSVKTAKWIVAGFWISTVIFALQMGFTAYAQLRLPQVSGAFAHYGFPGYFRIELAWAKFVGLAALLIPMVPARVKEWAYAGFAITLVSALIAHFAVGDGFVAWGWAAGTSVLWGVSYFFFRRVQASATAI